MRLSATIELRRLVQQADLLATTHFETLQSVVQAICNASLNLLCHRLKGACMLFELFAALFCLCFSQLQGCLCATGEALITAPWPSQNGPVDSNAVQQFEALQSVVRAIRNARAEYGVELGRKIPATIRVAADSTR